MIGPLRSGLDAAEAVEDTLRRWLPSTVAEVSARLGETLNQPTVIEDMPITVDAMTAIATPAIAVATSGLAETPTRNGSGHYSASYSITVRVLARAGSYRATARAVHGYTIAITAALLQHRSLGGKANGLQWVDQDYQVIDPDQTRTLAGADVGFIVTLKDVLDDTAGPLQPPDLPQLPPAAPTVQTVDVTTAPMQED